MIGDAFANKITIQTLADSTNSIGTNNQILKSNGTNTTWGNLTNAEITTALGHTVEANVPSNAEFTDTTYTATTSKLVTTTVSNITSVGTATQLGTGITATDITGWTSNTPTNFEITGEKLVITPGSKANITFVEKTIPNVISAGTTPTLGTAITVATGNLAANGSGSSVVTGITGS